VGFGATTYFRLPLPSHLSLESGVLLVHRKLTITRGSARAGLFVKEGVVPAQYVNWNTWSVSADTLRNEGLYAGVYGHGAQASFNISVRCFRNALLFSECVQG
jgi:hypothetical protein